ncbi:MAG: metallophosphoesterase [Eubacteriales bacterium]|nr:metallophosphoesterase [Eubacteriales bacterium]
MGRNFSKNILLRIASVIGGVLLLILVFYMASVDQGSYGRNGKTDLPALNDSGKVTLISSGKTVWKYLDEEQEEFAGSGDSTKWTENKFDASGWKEASGSFGAKNGERKEMGKGNAPNNLLVQYEADDTSSPVYLFRTELIIANPDSIGTLSGEVEFDDAALIYINGELVWAGNNPDGGYERLTAYGAKEPVSSPRSEKFIIKDTSVLKRGKNTVAVEVHQNYASGSDIFFDFTSLTGQSQVQGEEEIDTSGLILEVGESEKSVRVNWYTEEKGAFELQYALRHENTETETYAVSLMGRQKGEAKGAYCYTAELKPLSAGKEYVYRIRRLGSQDISERYTFDGAEEGDDFTFLFSGDPQIGADERTADGVMWEKALEKSSTLVPDAAFLITAGDQTDSSDEDDARLEFLEFRRPEILKHLPVAVNVGNHEVQNNLYEKQFRRDGQGGMEYSFMYKNVLFVALDLFNDGPEDQAEFLRKEIQDHPADWVVVTMHYSLFSAGSHAYDESVIRLRKQLAPVFSQYGVDLVLAGHDHSYTRTCYMKGLEPTGTTGGKKNTGEVLYLTGGSSTGNKYYEKNKEEIDYDAFFLDKEIPVMTSVSVTEKSLVISTYDLEEGKKIDSCRMTK